MTERPWRLFVAIAISDALRRDLAAATEGWAMDPRLDGLRWTDPSGWHLTLAFLGGTEPARVPALTDAVGRAVAAHEPMQLATGGLGAFPGPSRARVAWYGIADAAGRLRALARSVRAAVGLDASQPFRPHLTIARARRDPLDVRPWLREASAPAGSLAVDEVALMRSHLGRGPARYELVAAVPIGAAARV